MTHPVITDLAVVAHLLATKRHHDRRTQADVARALGITQSTLSDWENGVIIPPGDKLIAWLNISGFDLILGRKGSTPEQGKPA